MAIVAALALVAVGVAGWAALHHSVPTSHRPTALERQLAAARQAVGFPIRQPRWLPAGVRLAQVETLGCQLCGKRVRLDYATGGTAELSLEEGLGAQNLSVEVMVADGKWSPMAETVSLLSLAGTSAALHVFSDTIGSVHVETDVVAWTLDGVPLALTLQGGSSRDITTSDLLRIAASV
jgi:hypothetical protein